MGTTSIKLITSDGVELGWGTFPAGGVVYRSGGSLTGAPLVTIDSSGNLTATNMPRRATATIDFGATPTDDGAVVVTGQSWVVATSRIHAWSMSASTADNTIDDHEALATFARFFVSDLVVGVGFTIQCNVLHGYFTGLVSVQWEGI